MSVQSNSGDLKGQISSGSEHTQLIKLDQQAASRSFIGKAVYIKGDLVAKNEDVMIDGRLEGTIAVKSNKLEIGLEGRIQANVFAKVAIVSGELFGDVYASDQVIITKTGRVTGDIYTADVSIEDGAHIKGKIDMQKQDLFKQHVAPEVSDDAKGGLGFLFKKGKDTSSPDVAIPQDTNTNNNINVSEELAPLAQSSCTQYSNIGESVIIKGELIAEEDVVIQGQVDGIIYFKNNNLGVGPHSLIKANIYVKSIIAHGEIKGDIYASDQAMIKKPGHVYGKICSPRVSTEKGAVIMGSIDMNQQNIESAFASIGGGTAVIEHAHHDKAEHAQHDEAKNHGAAKKDSSWPIFYPREKSALAFDPEK